MHKVKQKEVLKERQNSGMDKTSKGDATEYI